MNQRAKYPQTRLDPPSEDGGSVLFVDEAHHVGVDKLTGKHCVHDALLIGCPVVHARCSAR